MIISEFIEKNPALISIIIALCGGISYFITKKYKTGTNNKLKSKNVIASGDVIVGTKHQNTSINSVIASNNTISNLEKMVLKVLSRVYRESGNPCCGIADVHKELEIKEGTYVGVLNSSKYIKIDGESYIMTDEGIRYFDSLDSKLVDQIVLPKEQKEVDRVNEIQRQRFSENRKKFIMDSAR